MQHENKKQGIAANTFLQMGARLSPFTTRGLSGSSITALLQMKRIRNHAPTPIATGISTAARLIRTQTPKKRHNPPPASQLLFFTLRHYSSLPSINNHSKMSLPDTQTSVSFNKTRLHPLGTCIAQLVDNKSQPFSNSRRAVLEPASHRPPYQFTIRGRARSSGSPPFSQLQLLVELQQLDKHMVAVLR